MATTVLEPTVLGATTRQAIGRLLLPVVARNCPYCGGSGTRTCPFCGGSGKNGKQDCYACNGTGQATCPDCGGSGRQ